MITSEDIAALVTDEEIASFITPTAEIYPIESDLDGDVLKIWYSNNQVLEIKLKWTVMERQDER